MIKEETRMESSTVFEGMTSIRACIKAQENSISDRKIICVYVDSERTQGKGKELSYIKAMSFKLGYDIKNVSSEFIDSHAVGNTHGGIIAECSDRTIPKLSDSIDSLKSDGFYVMIEGIEDPYNFGYAIRSLYACGVDGIILSERNWMSAAGVVCRSSAGTSELIPLFTSDSSEACDVMKNKGYKVLCAGIRDSVSSFDCDMRKPVFLVVGGEKRGISRAVLDKADTIVRIDYAGEFSSSLSAASSATILAYEIMRNNRTK